MDAGGTRARHADGEAVLSAVKTAAFMPMLVESAWRPSLGFGTRADLFHGHRFGQIARLIDIGAAQYRDVVGQQLQGQGEHRRGDHLAAHVQAQHARRVLAFQRRDMVGDDVQLAAAWTESASDPL
jgi:hypothetical protein